jgi:membrane peptidoglycan carboxypeptidase
MDIAIRLERQYTKNEIIAMYCNVMILETILSGKFRS